MGIVPCIPNSAPNTPNFYPLYIIRFLCYTIAVYKHFSKLSQGEDHPWHYMSLTAASL